MISYTNKAHCLFYAKAIHPHPLRASLPCIDLFFGAKTYLLIAMNQID